MSNLSLDPEQEAIAEAKPDGVVLGRSGAGGGKTRVIRARVPFILRYRDSRYQSQSKLLVNAYNKDVAAEIKGHLEVELSKSDFERVTVKTFHGIAMSMLYRNTRHTPVKPSQTSGNNQPFDLPKQAHLIQQLSDLLNTGPMIRFKNGQINGLLQLEGYAHARGIELEEAYGLVGKTLLDLIDLPPDDSCEIVRRMRDWRFANGQLTFDDLLPLANALPAAAFQNMRFMDVIADELQDLNFQQRLITNNFLRYAQSFTGLGDPNQCIYSFNGADPRIFEQMKKDFANRRPQEYFITTTYRCAEPIIKVANQILKNDLGQTVMMRGVGHPGTPVEVVETGDVGLIQFLKQREASGEAWKDMAVLYRTRRQSADLEMALAASDIPYILADASFFERNEIQDMLAYFFAMYDSKPDYNYWRRVVKHQPALTWGVAKNAFAETDGDPFQLGYTPMSVRKNDKMLAAWKDLQTKIEAYLALEKEPLALAWKLKADLTDYWGEHAQNPDDLEDKLETVNGFIRWLTKFEGASGFDILEAVRNYESGNKHEDPDADAVRVMTLHKSKGLEWNTVALYNVGYGSLPLRTTNQADLDSENRLLYVGVTRAKRALGMICQSPETAASVSLTKYARSGEALARGVQGFGLDLDALDLLAG